MKLIVSLCICTFVIVSNAAVVPSYDDLKLELVQVLFRHGARTPVQLELNVCNYTDISAYEPWGLGQLTNKGKQQEYNFGEFLKNRYANYLGSNYKSEDVYAYASDISRTKMSLELVLAGLYPPFGRTQWNKHLNWSPIPYYYVPSRLDVLLRYFENPKFLKLLKETVDSNEFKNKLARYSDFFAFLEERTLPSDKSPFINTVMVFDVLISNEYMNLPLPDWYTPKVRQTFLEIMELFYNSWAMTTEMRRLAIGPLIKTFIENMNLDGTMDNPRKIYLYGGHDVNVGLFTRSHNIQEFRNPFFGSALIVETLRDLRTNRIYVKFLAWNGLGHLTTLKLNNREECCSIDDYLEIVKPVVPSEMEIDDMLGSLNSTEIRNLFFDNNSKTDLPPYTTFFI